MDSPQTLPVSETASANADSSAASNNALSRRMRSEIIRLTIIAVVIFIVAIILHGGYWLEVALDHRNYHVDDIIIGVFIVSFVLAVFLVRGWQEVQQEARERAEAVREMEQRNVINEQLSQMSSLLQACFAMEEASKVISHYAQGLFPEYTGALYVFRSSRNLLEVVATWGEGQVNEPMFGPQQCWGLRQGQMYAVRDPRRSLICDHVHDAHAYVCLPMMAHGEVLALLHVSPNPGKTISDGDYALLRVFTEPIALALSNLKLRDTLRQQSIRDPLTGLFNRRYLEETLALEVERVRRNKVSFTIIMLDLDHFKRFNDTHGHEAGDAVLQALGGFLRRHVRGGDIACRYGGEEFTLVFPGTSLEDAQLRAEQLCEGIRALHVEFKNQVLGPLTLSVGVATFPNHGDSGEMVLQAADTALYQAKSEGRDRIVVAV